MKVVFLGNFYTGFKDTRGSWTANCTKVVYFVSNTDQVTPRLYKASLTSNMESVGGGSDHTVERQETGEGPAVIQSRDVCHLHHLRVGVTWPGQREAVWQLITWSQTTLTGA